MYKGEQLTLSLSLSLLSISVSLLSPSGRTQVTCVARGHSNVCFCHELAMLPHIDQRLEESAVCFQQKIYRKH